VKFRKLCCLLESKNVLQNQGVLVELTDYTDLPAGYATQRGGLKPPNTPMNSLSIIIPTLNEERQIGRALEALLSLPSVLEIIVVDGGSRDRTVELARAFSGVRVVEFGRANRAQQMNAGARNAQGEALLFLHADVCLPTEALAAVRQALAEATVVGGCFEFSFPAESSLAFRLYARGVNLRTRLFRTATGDQAIFVRRVVFNALGGYRDMLLMEDIELFNALKRRGAVAILPQRVVVSPRRWQQRGLVRTGLLMYALRLGHRLGISPTTLKSFFVDVR
jgi:rSAM/selenodomain-associated transferase 2